MNAWKEYPFAALHASAPEGMKCADCTMGKEPCPACYTAFWKKRHPNTVFVGGDEAAPSMTTVEFCGKPVAAPCAIEEQCQYGAIPDTVLRDATRYRWLRDTTECRFDGGGWWLDFNNWISVGATLPDRAFDKAIDAAIASYVYASTNPTTCSGKLTGKWLCACGASDESPKCRRADSTISNASET